MIQEPELVLSFSSHLPRIRQGESIEQLSNTASIRTRIIDHILKAKYRDPIINENILELNSKHSNLGKSRIVLVSYIEARVWRVMVGTTAKVGRTLEIVWPMCWGR